MNIMTEDTVATRDGFEYWIKDRLPDGTYRGVRINSHSQRLFYSDGQYVGAGDKKDIVGYSE